MDETLEHARHRSACDVAGQAVKAATAHRTKMLAQACEAQAAYEVACGRAREAAKTKPFIYWPADFPGGNDELLDQAIDDLAVAQTSYYTAHHTAADAQRAQNRAKELAES
jgi:hypothetical protein